MNGYTFTKQTSNCIDSLKAESKYKNFDIDNLNLTDYLKLIASKVSLSEIRNSEEYRDADFWFHETTSSCSRKEAIEWMKYYMLNSIAYGLTAHTYDWVHKFVAAWDIFNELCK